jgi:hypothetical protein
MKLKYSPCKWNPYAASQYADYTKSDTVITVMDDNALNIDGDTFEFDPMDVEWPTISTDTNGVILEAHRVDGELYVTVRRFYTGSCSDWDTRDYHEVTI